MEGQFHVHYPLRVVLSSPSPDDINETLREKGKILVEATPFSYSLRRRPRTPLFSKRNSSLPNGRFFLSPRPSCSVEPSRSSWEQIGMLSASNVTELGASSSLDEGPPAAFGTFHRVFTHPTISKLFPRIERDSLYRRR